MLVRGIGISQSADADQQKGSYKPAKTPMDYCDWAQPAALDALRVLVVQRCFGLKLLLR